MEIGQNRTISSDFMAKKRRLLIAQIVSQNEFTNEEIAKQFKIVPSTLWEWRKHPDFVAEVARLTQEEGEAAARYSIAKKDKRIRVGKRGR